MAQARCGCSLILKEPFDRRLPVLFVRPVSMQEHEREGGLPSPGETIASERVWQSPIQYRFATLSETGSVVRDQTRGSLVRRQSNRTLRRTTEIGFLIGLLISACRAGGPTHSHNVGRDCNCHWYREIPE